MPVYDVARVSICGIIIVFDALGASNELGAKVPETAETRSSLYFIDWPYGRPGVFCTVFCHACLLYGIRVFRPLGPLFVTKIYRSGVFGHFNLYTLTAVYRSCVFTLHTRDTSSDRDLTAQCFSFRIIKHDC